MKIQYIEEDELNDIRRQLKGRLLKPKAPKLDHKLISRVGKVLYNFPQAKEVSIKIKLKGGTSIAFFRSEDDDRFEKIRRRIDDSDEGDD